MNEFDEKRIAAIDAANTERKLTETPSYGWEDTVRRIQALENQVDLWHKQALAAQGREAHLRRALEMIIGVYQHTSAAGPLMSRIAHDALDRPYSTGFEEK